MIVSTILNIYHDMKSFSESCKETKSDATCSLYQSKVFIKDDTPFGSMNVTVENPNFHLYLLIFIKKKYKFTLE